MADNNTNTNPKSNKPDNDTPILIAEEFLKDVSGGMIVAPPPAIKPALYEEPEEPILTYQERL